MNSIKSLKDMGIDIYKIVDGTQNPKIQKHFHKRFGDVEIPKWSKNDIIEFSNRIYEIVTKHKDSYSK